MGGDGGSLGVGGGGTVGGWGRQGVAVGVAGLCVGGGRTVSLGDAVGVGDGVSDSLPEQAAKSMHAATIGR